LRGPLISIVSNDAEPSVLRRIDNGSIDHLVVIIVDAKTKPETKIDKSPSPPGLKTVLTKISTVPLENYSFDTVQALRNEFKQLEKDSLNYKDCEDILHQKCPDAKMPFDPPRKIKLYPIYVGFDQIADKKERHYYQTMDTSFHLPDQQVTDLRKIARKLLDQSDAYKELKKDLQVEIETSQ
jgi:NTE family protein